MRNKIFSGLLWLSTAAVVIASVLIAVIMYQGSMTTMQHDLRQEAAFIKIGMEQDEKSYLQALQAEGNKVTRVTLIAPDGSCMIIMCLPKKCSITKTGKKCSQH